MPLGMHKFANKAAEATHCAQEQGKFWEIHDSMMSDQKKLGDLNSYAESIGLDVAQFEACLNSNKYATEVQKDISAARKLGISGTPSFVIARTDPKDPTKVKSISLIRGAQPFAAFKRLIDQALTEAQK
jgi:protein-disulfide isomerase